MKTTPTNPTNPAIPVSSRLRAIRFRLAAVALGLAPFAVLEVLFWCFGAGVPRYDSDPFVGFHAVRPLFVLSEDQRRYEIDESRLGFFRPDSFAAGKGPNEFRIFCLGGSTVQGRPFAVETSFPTFLELSLRAAEPEREWEVVNCGGVSYASYRLVPILEEVLQYEPDLIVVYTGHNEFLEDRSYGHLKRLPAAVAWPARILAKTRTYQVLSRIGRSETADDSGTSHPILPEEVDAMLEYRGGMDKYRRDEAWRRDIDAHFKYNLHRMVALARQARVPLLLVNPVCNLRDCPPFKSEHRDGLTPEQLKRWEGLVAEACEHHGENAAETLRLLEEALEIDDRHAGLCYLLAKTHDAMGDLSSARQEYIAAKENDICPLRILESMNQAILDTACTTDTPLVDVRRMYDEFCEGGIPGGMYLIDHVHPSIEGHQLIADLIASKLSLMGVVHPRPDWRERRNAIFRAQLDSLDSLYYSRGQQRLESLRMWTQGKAGTQWSYEGKEPVFLSPPGAEDSREAQGDASPPRVPVPSAPAPAGAGSE
ncbi:MAG: SGNH/GDSL hydrolase family protein [Planctomycetaceae bacterium]|nr:SGNH/GDSL hydrolase family protein [Planctomycetaceae bacterium]